MYFEGSGGFWQHILKVNDWHGPRFWLRFMPNLQTAWQLLWSKTSMIADLHKSGVVRRFLIVIGKQFGAGGGPMRTARFWARAGTVRAARNRNAMVERVMSFTGCFSRGFGFWAWAFNRARCRETTSNACPALLARTISSSPSRDCNGRQHESVSPSPRARHPSTPAGVRCAPDTPAVPPTIGSRRRPACPSTSRSAPAETRGRAPRADRLPCIRSAPEPPAPPEYEMAPEPRPSATR